MNKSLNIDITAYEGISEIKKNYSFKSFSDCISSMTYFFKNNNISPRENILNNYSESLFALKKELLNKLEDIEKKEHQNTERVIKIQRRIEEDLLKPVSKKINDIHKSTITDFNTKHNLEHLKKQEIESYKSKEINKVLELNEIIKEQDKSIEEHKKISDNQEKLLAEYYRCMKKLNENMKVEKTTFGKKIYINLPVEDAEKLFHLIP